VPAFLWAVLGSTALIVRILLRDREQALLLVPPLAIMEALILWMGWRFFREFVPRLRRLVSQIPDRADELLQVARFSTRLFVFGMTGIGLAMFMGSIILYGILRSRG
jgi:hypothetical protein